ncbi:prolyl oligopeptidase family serine peptidase [Aureibaculum sp. 2210JD6-5]|uniref:carboxylesterase family protein n=1 Tax=Aureibaculum sp. 2210JD6-5 TaxID=3103957 RepID=UPI002AACA308|nr:prolyl oligopeptidase family serine peptidase [Aureibaculum sp. 2210JD6-5]MDY7395463.1 prolyl oligopeptidase family serine peptidase [Aureibaculum sp. 2210JD6-5]
MKIKTLLLLFIIAIKFSVAQQSNEKFIIEQEYLKYLPENYDDDLTKKWPLLIFLHGAGERGSDLEKIKVHGPPMLVEQGKQFPFIILSPQAKRGWDEDLLYELIRDFIDNNKRVDTDRIYLTGLSMGGYGTWKLAQKHPEMFAAIVPICGGGNPEDVWKLRHMPVWCFHGKLDGIVPLSASETMVEALKKVNDNVKFTVYPETYHDSWIQAYNDPKLYDWLLQQKKFKHQEVELPLKTLDNFVGNYDFKMGSFKDTANISIDDGKLIMNIGKNKTVLIPSSDTTFFIDKNQPIEFEFRKNENGIVDKILFYTNEIITMPKITN